jgi:membrane protein
MARSRRRRGSHWQSFKELVALWRDIFARHGLLTYASAIAFQLLIAGVAVALLGLALLGEVGRTDVWDQQLGPQLAPKVLPPVYAGIDATVQKIFSSSSGGLIAFAAAVTIWEMSGVVRACMGALSRIYDHEDDRSWKIRFPLSIGIGMVLTLAIVAAIFLATAAKGAVNGWWSVPWAIGRWLLAIVCILIAFGVLVRFAPAESRTTRWASGGASLVVVAWIVQSLLFALYLRHVANWQTSVGSLLGAYFLTTYLYVASIVLLVGVQLDELLRKDVQGEDERGILDLVRGVI